MGGHILLKLEQANAYIFEEGEFISENRGTAYMFIISLLCLLHVLHK